MGKNKKGVFHCCPQNRELIKEALKLGEKIKDARIQNGLSQEELAVAVSVTRQTIISLENGKYNASLMLAYEIAKYFGKTIEEVFIFEEE